MMITIKKNKIKSILVLSFSMLFFACDKEGWKSGVPINLAGNNKVFISTLGEGGFQIIDNDSKSVISTIKPKKPLTSIDDVAVDGNLLFVLDSRVMGYVSSYDISNPSNPVLVSNGISVPTEPFNGIDAKNGFMCVSGGTKRIQFFTYDSEGNLSKKGCFNEDRGHPDLSMSLDGKIAFVSTHFSIGNHIDDQEFGLISVNTSTEKDIDRVGVAGAGFAGSIKPSSWAQRMFVTSNYVYIAHAGGLTIVEYNNQGNLTIKNNFTLPIQAVDVFVENNTAYVIGNTPSPTLLKIDVSDVLEPQINKNIKIENQNALLSGLFTTTEMSQIVIAANEAKLIYREK